MGQNEVLRYMCVALFKQTGKRSKPAVENQQTTRSLASVLEDGTREPASVIVPQYDTCKIIVFVWGKIESYCSAITEPWKIVGRALGVASWLAYLEGRKV